VTSRARRARRARPARRWYRRKAVLWAAGSVFAILVVLGAFAAVRLVRVARDLRDARHLLDSAGQHIENGDLAAARDELARSQQLLTRSNSQLYNSPSLEILGLLPVVHQNLASLRDGVGLALRMTDGGSNILAITKPLESPSGKLEVPFDHGTIPLAAVHDAQAATDQLAAVLPQQGVRPHDSFVIGPIADAQRELYEQAGMRRAQLDSVSHGLSLLAGLSGEAGPKRYLIAVANPAEMRGAGGMVLSYGILESNKGTFTLGEFGKIDDLFLDTAVDPASLHLPADYLARWGNLEPTRLWRNATVHPDFAFDAPILEAMFTAKTQLPVDGVIQIDPVGLAAILTGTGPVTVEGLGEVNAGNVVDLTINRAYIDFPNRDQRQELLGDVARAAFDKLINGKLDSMRTLGDAVFKASQGRHILFHSVDAGLEAETRYFGATGELPAPGQDYALLAVQNFGQNKLDYYLDTSVQLAGRRPEKAPGELTATITITNTAPANGRSAYVFGETDPGVYRGVVSLYLPDGTTLNGAGGDPTASPAIATADGGRTAVSFDVEIPPGEQRTVTLRLALVPRPAGDYQFELVPIGRVRPTVFAVDIETGRGRVTRDASPLTSTVFLRSDG